MVNKYHGGGADIDKKVTKRDWTKIPKTLGLSDAEKKLEKRHKKKKLRSLLRDKQQDHLIKK